MATRFKSNLWPFAACHPPFSHLVPATPQLSCPNNHEKGQNKLKKDKLIERKGLHLNAVNKKLSSLNKTHENKVVVQPINKCQTSNHHDAFRELKPHYTSYATPVLMQKPEKF